MDGIKRVENRTWITKYRGPLVIVAGTSKLSLGRGTDFIEALGIAVPSDLVFGAILGVVNLVDVVSPTVLSDPFAEGPHCWLLSNPVKLTRPVPYKGRLGLFALTEGPQTENLEAIAANLRDAHP